jgi:hypothetical protein
MWLADSISCGDFAERVISCAENVRNGWIVLKNSDVGGWTARVAAAVEDFS